MDNKTTSVASTGTRLCLELSRFLSSGTMQQVWSTCHKNVDCACENDGALLSRSPAVALRRTRWDCKALEWLFALEPLDSENGHETKFLTEIMNPMDVDALHREGGSGLGQVQNLAPHSQHAHQELSACPLGDRSGESRSFDGH